MRTQQASATADQNASMARLFNDYDVRETSHHLQIIHFDLHICDDTNAKDRGTTYAHVILLTPKCVTEFSVKLKYVFFTLQELIRD